jgi:hypothetical protein
MNDFPRRALVPVALTLTAQLFVTLLLSRPGESVNITIKRISKAPFAPGDSDGGWYTVVGKVDDGGAIYRRVRFVNLVLARVDPAKPNNVQHLGTAAANYNATTGEFSVKCGFGAIKTEPAPYIAVEARDLAGRTYTKRLESDG